MKRDNSEDRERLRPIDVPQSDSLATIRAIVLARKQCGTADARSIGETSSVSQRHVNYRLQAARILNLVDADNSLTKKGSSLLATKEGSPAERSILVGAIENCRVVSALFPDLVAGSTFDVDKAASKIRAATGMSYSTAHRRARVLRSWKRQLVEYGT